MTVTVCSFGRDGSKKIFFALELNNKIINFIFSIHIFDLVQFLAGNNVLDIFLWFSLSEMECSRASLSQERCDLKLSYAEERQNVANKISRDRIHLTINTNTMSVLKLKPHLHYEDYVATMPNIEWNGEGKRWFLNNPKIRATAN